MPSCESKLAYVQKQQKGHGKQDCTDRVEPGLAIVCEA